MKNPAVKYVAAALLVVLVLGLQFAGVFADDEGTQATEPTTPSPTAVVTIEPVGPGDDSTAPTEGPDEGSDESEVPGFDEQVAAEAAAARSTWSWQDRDALGWAGRLAELSSDNYADQLSELPITAVDEEAWTHGVIAPEATTRVSNVSVKLLDGSAASGTVDLTVGYDVEISYAKPELMDDHAGEGVATSPTKSPAAGEWTPLYPEKVNMRFVFEGDRWVVDAVSYPAS